MDTSDPGPGIAEFYSNRSVFITGGTGFMGKVLIEKLLRSCPKISQIFVLVRPKRGNSVSRRLEDLIESPIFGYMHQKCPDQMKKIRPVAGDMLLPGLGISEYDLKLLQESVTVVFHSAAIIRFDEPLKSAVEMNLKGVKKVLELCNQLTKLQSLVHVSTAYVNINSEVLGEDLNTLNYDSDKLQSQVDTMDEKDLESFTTELLTDLKLPNTYTLVKCLGEQVLLQQTTAFQLSIIRPSIIVGAYKEPIPGWTDNMNGPAGLTAGCALGFLQSIYGDPEKITDFIPVEYPVNLMIAAPWGTRKNWHGKARIYTVGTGGVNPVRWSNFHEELDRNIRERPTTKAVWPLGGQFYKSLFVHQVNTVLFHFIPAIFVDTFMMLCRKKPMMIHLYSKANKTMGCLAYYTVREWRTECSNTIALHEELDDLERQEFNFDPRTVIWKDYFSTYWGGVRKFILKDDELTLPAARKRMRRLVFLQRTLRVCLLFGLLRVTFWNYSIQEITGHNLLYSSFNVLKSSLGYLR